MNEPQTPLSPLSHIPANVFCAQDYEFLAQRFIAAPSFAYIAGGSAHDVTLAANREAFAELSIVPRLLRDVTHGHTRLELLGQPMPHPVLLAPVAFQTLAHPRGELDTARGAAAMEACVVSSTLSSYPLEDIARTGGPARWFQLYLQPDREITLDLLRRAEAAGYRAIVVTLDAAVQRPSLRALRAGFQMPPHCTPANLQGYPVPEAAPGAGQSPVFQGLMRAAPTQDDLAWLLEQTILPVLVKGVLHPDDARALQTMGVAGLVISNHGGRALDGAPATLRMLPAIRAAVGDGYPLLLDGGIRSGTDIFKAIAQGADAVMIGRLQVYALSVAGALGVAHMLRLLREELEACMAMAGCATLADIRQASLIPQREEPSC
ncbi:MAG: alpha-hydroxy acid oxidase [Pseudomonadota bacterium]